MGEMKRYAKRAVKELCVYESTKSLIEPFCTRIDAATSANQISRIMYDLREQL